ncbi:thymidylate synthase [Salinimonas chungwhensis]|uniref:thymidylate synthase n=1 Tax=Salinimonas chungwhensis TaxID=265425 RepID=UPI00036739B2|nr:thymidylate synthase [Salinimonas chungwhensis]
MEIEGESIDEIIRSSLCILKTQGKENTPTKGKNLELTGVLLTLSDPLNRVSRAESKNTLYSCLGELTWYLSGSEDAEHMIYYLSRYRNYAELDGTVGGAYGPRLIGQSDSVNQIENIISILEHKPSSRQAVIQIFDKHDLVNKKKDIPCTQTLQFILRENCLELIATMRSNDVFRGLPHDIFCFTMLQELVASELSSRLNRKIKLGSYKHFVGSFHVYDEDSGLIGRYNQEGYPNPTPIMTPMPENSYADVRNFIEVEKEIRKGELGESISAELPPYWGDLTIMLKSFKIYKSNPLDGCRKLQSQIENLSNSNYKPIIQKLIDKIRKK